MTKNPYLRVIIYMLIAVWALYLFKSISMKQAVSMSLGVLAGAALGFLLTRLFIKKK